MRAGTYYAIAAVLVLATVPMYRYIFHRARDLDKPQVPRVGQVDAVPAVYAQLPRAAVPERVPLLPGESCMGGVVVLVSGSTYANAVDASGHAVRCEGSYVLR